MASRPVLNGTHLVIDDSKAHARQSGNAMTRTSGASGMRTVHRRKDVFDKNLQGAA